MRDRDKKRIISFTVLGLLAIGLIIGGYFFIKTVSKMPQGESFPIILSAVEAVGLTVSIILASHQLRDSKELGKATFVMELNRTFVDNEDYMFLYNVMQDCLDGKCPHRASGACPIDCKDCEFEIPKSKISNYLTFFETIYILVKNGDISFEILDDLFAYRFFLGVHHPLIQEAKLRPQPKNFENIFALEREWLAYRKKKGKDNEEPGSTVYTRNLLKDMELPQGVKYEDLI